MDIQLVPYTVEILLSGGFLVQGILKPLGDLVVFLNDTNRSSFPLENVKLYPLSAARQVSGLQQRLMTINKKHVVSLSLLQQEEAGRVQLLNAQRKVVIYTSQFVFRGGLHVNSDTPDEDMLDDSREFYPLTDAEIYPLAPVARQITMPVSLLLAQRSLIQTYHRLN